MAIGKITSKSLESNAVTSTNLAPGAVTIADIADGEITASKLHTTLDLSTKTLTLTQASVTAHQGALSVTQSQISDLSTTSDLTEGTNLYYTNARADARVALLVDSAPGTLNTLNELAAALGDDANFSTTVTNSIAAKLPLAGGAITGNVTFGDSVKATFGASSDLQIYHTGSNSVIADAGTGDLKIRANNLLLESYTSEDDYLTAIDGGAVTIFYDGSEKLATTSTGIDVTGTVTSDGLTVDGTSGYARLQDLNASVVSGTDMGGIEWRTADSTVVGVNRITATINVEGDGTFNAADKAPSRMVFSTHGISGASPVERMCIDSSGNVGINISNPATKLHVGGIVQVAENSNTAFYGGNYVRVFGDQNYGFRDTGGSYIANISMSGNSYFNGGNVGIGTSNPSQTLHIQGTTASSGDARSNVIITDDTSFGLGVGGGAVFRAKYNTAGSITNMASIQGIKENATDGNYAGALVFTSRLHAGANTEAMRISSSGNVGIGTTNPVDRLHIYGNEGNSTMGIVLQDDGWGAPNGQYKLTVRNSDGAFAIRKNTSSNFDFATSEDHLVLTSSSGKGKLGINRDTNLDSTVTIEQATDGTDGGIRIYGSNSNSIRGQMYYDGTQSFVIHGTSGPSGEYSTLRFATGLYNNPQIRMSINKDNGFVGIGTTTPSTGLEISGSGNTSRIKLINGSDQLNLGLWDGSNYRMEGDANRPILLTSYHSDGIKLGGSGATNLQIKDGRVTSPTDPAISFNPAGISSGTGFKVYEQLAPYAANAGSAWPVMQTAVFTAHMNGTLRIRANMYIQSGQYYFKWRIKNQMSGAVLWDSYSDGGQAYAGYEYPAGQSGNVHNPKYYVFDVPGFEAGQRYSLEMSPSNYAGSIEATNGSQTLYLKEFIVLAEGTHMSSQTIPRGKVPRYNTPTPANNSSTGAVLSQASSLNTHISLGVHEKYLGSVTFRANASYLDFRTNLSSNSYMFYMICTGYLYNDGVFNHAMRGGYMYTNNSVINQQASTPSGSDAWYNFYRDGSGRLCGKLNKGQNAYTEGKVHLYFGTHDSNDQNVYITDVCMNNTTSSIF